MDERFNELSLPEEERWENLTLANDFIFGKVFQDMDLCLELVRLILPELNIERVVSHERQKFLRETLDTNGVIFDIYLRDDKDRIINVEMQTAKSDNIPKRTRAYHSMIDLDALNSENIKTYTAMPEAIVIFICNFDLFKLGRHIYTFRNYCVQERDLMLGDGTTTIFLNTKGKADDISPELKSFLELVRGKSSEDEFVKRLESRLRYAKQNSKWRQIYMLTKFDRNEYIEEGIERGIKLGIEQGLEQGRAEGIAIGEKLGREKVIQNFLNVMRERYNFTIDDYNDMEEILRGETN